MGGGGGGGVNITSYSPLGLLLRNASLWTPVDCASAGGWAAIVELLADAQADVCTTDKPNKVKDLEGDSVFVF